MNLDDLPRLRESLDAHGLLARKSFGQHFLLDLNLTRKIARLAGPLAGRVVIEVGPGPGGLTRALLESAAAHVIAVEKDPRFLPLRASWPRRRRAGSRAGGGRARCVRGRSARHLAPAGRGGWVQPPYNVGTRCW